MIKKIGIEMEGGICDICYNTMKRVYPTMRTTKDWSVNVQGFCERHQEKLNSKEMKICFPYTAMNRLEEFIHALYNTSFTQNETCGNHMHFSFTNLKQHFVKPDFVFEYQEKYLKAFSDKEKYMQRLKCGYCRFIKSPADLVETMTPYLEWHRYRAINFHSWFEHHTYEFRIMPYAESADEYLNQLKFNIEYINTYLAQRRYFKRVVVEHEKSYIALIPHENDVTIELSVEHTPRLERNIMRDAYYNFPYHFVCLRKEPVFDAQNRVNFSPFIHTDDPNRTYIPPTWGLMLSYANPLAMSI